MTAGSYLQTVLWETAQWGEWPNICRTLPNARHSPRPFTNTPFNPHNNTDTDGVIHILQTEASLSLLSPHLMALELGLEQKGEETPTRKKPVRMCRHNPVPSGWVTKHVLDMNHFLVWWPSTSYCLPFVPELPFWRVPTLYGSGERGNCYLLYHRCQKGQGTPFHSPLQPSQGGRGGLGSDWAKWKFAPRAPNPEHVRKQWGGVGDNGGWGVTFSQLCRWYAGQLLLGEHLRYYSFIVCLEETGCFPFFKTVLEGLGDFVSPKQPSNKLLLV